MKISRLVVLAAVCFAISPVLLQGCSQSSIVQAVTASEVTSTGEPKTAADTFSPDVNTIYCSVKLAYTNIKSSVNGRWYIIKSDEAQLTNTMIAEGKVVAGTQYVVLAFARSDKLLPKGDYEVKLYFDDQYVRSVPFKVQGEAAASKATLSEATLCTSIELLSDKPIDNVDVFASDVSKIFCSVKLNNADFNTTVKARWTYVSGEIENLKGKVIYEPSTKAEGRKYISFSIGMPPGKQMPIGQYNVALFVEGMEQANLPFKVVDPASIKWPNVSEISTYVYADQERKIATLTSRFPADTKEIDLRARSYNAPPGTQINIRWKILQGADAVVYDQVIKEDRTKIEGTVEIRGSISVSKEPFVKGVYQVTVLADDREMGTVHFQVQ